MYVQSMQINLEFRLDSWRWKQEIGDRFSQIPQNTGDFLLGDATE